VEIACRGYEVILIAQPNGLHLQLDQLISYLGKGHIMADQEELVIPVFGHFFPTNIDGTEGMGQVLAPCGGNWF
jgi:hypothetical protein